MEHAIQHSIDSVVIATPKDLVEGSAEVVAYYGVWPNFHDADYVSIQVNMDGPTVSINFRLYDWNDELQTANRPSLTLTWYKVEDLKLSGIEEIGQNAIGQLTIDIGGEGITTLIQSAGNGTTVEIQASRLEVTHFDPNKEWDYETRNTAFD